MGGSRQLQRQKCMASPSNFPSKATNPSPENSNETSPTDPKTGITPSPRASNQQSRVLSGPVAILWDIENCPVPSDVRPEDVAGNIRMALRVHPVIKGAVTLFSAYGDFNVFPRRLREGCQRTGVKLVDVPNGRKDAADKAILVDMFLFALDNRPPSSILLISGDVDFAPALHILGQRGYTVILVIPSGVGVSSALSNAGRFVWDWPSVARGEGFVPPKSFISRNPEASSLTAFLSLYEPSEAQHEEESIVYRGLAQNEFTSSHINQTFRFNSSHVSWDHQNRASQSLTEYSASNLMAVSALPSSRSLSLPSGLNEVPSSERNVPPEWVQPGDIQGLKGQLVKLLELFGGSLPLVRVPPEYQKFFGRPLYLSEYGSCKLVHLVKKMADKLTIEGKGHAKFLSLKGSSQRLDKASVGGTPGKRENKKGKAQIESCGMNENEEAHYCHPNVGCSSDDGSSEEDGNHENIFREAGLVGQIKDFSRELEELLVSYAGRILLDSFELLYKQRYKKVLDYRSLGVGGLEELIEKVREFAILHEEMGTNRKFVVASCLGRTQ
ncbi:uncharacterized protein LOC18427978 isoform X1 [Amborella trichopoda]|nr:uncharacterized protein LOC18427978 isoform X1 [Amborella trichopoda]XP_020519127.1 uncharacterized protein LOC18427978 isoform X1 [Amborella trichopoda]XP_020519128.1 uncharacterized protein LOC18427978 isoform X1 [Amborella trichopoda]|eukprot:XP_006837082.2 uncharacterized protein LOC18427978 isoform X1 [Amborella trichopoda]